MSLSEGDRDGVSAIVINYTTFVRLLARLGGKAFKAKESGRIGLARGEEARGGALSAPQPLAPTVRDNRPR